MIYTPNNTAKFETVTVKEEHKAVKVIKVLQDKANRLSKQCILFTPMIIPCGKTRLLQELFGGINWQVELMPLAVTGGVVIGIAIILGTMNDIKAIKQKRATANKVSSSNVKQEIVFTELEDYRQLLDK